MKILNQLTIKHLKMNKKRTIVTIIGVLLSTALMVGIGLLLSTVQDNALRTAIAYSGNYHASFHHLEERKISILESNKDVKDYFYESIVGFSPVEEPYNHVFSYTTIRGVSESYFQNLKLLQGRYPNNDKEIVIDSAILSTNGDMYKIGDTITLSVGSILLEQEEYYEDDDSILANGTYQEKEKQTYTVVGIVSGPHLEDNNASYRMYTRYNKMVHKGLVTVFVQYKHPKKSIEVSDFLAKNLGLQKVESDNKVIYPDVNFNYQLLSMYGVSKYNNIEGTLSSILCIILTLISIGCTIVIYNSFAISVMERKKQFGLFASIGATKKQLRHTVFFEAIIIGLIGIPLGVLSSFIGIGVVIALINHLLPGVFTVDLVLTAIPELLVIPILFMIVVVLASAYIPAHRASKITPIEAIRLNDDIKIKGKKVKTHPIIHRLFGIEGEIALKNIKRNKKKYRITVISLVVSIVLFVSFSTFVEYGLKTSDDLFSLPDYDIALRMNYPEKNDYGSFIHTLKNYEGVEQYTLVKSGRLYSNSYTENILSSTIKERYLKNSLNDYLSISIISLSDEIYHEYLYELGLSHETNILLNTVSFVTYEEDNRKVFTTPVLQDSHRDYAFDLCRMKEIEEIEVEGEEIEEDDIGFDCVQSLSSVYLTDKVPFALKQYVLPESLTIIVPMATFDTLFHDGDSEYIDEISMYLKAKDYKPVDQYIEEQIENRSFDNIIYVNVQKATKLQQNIMLVIAILLYGFITLVTLIGVTSVFNTINTSMALRRKEFAMLRSMGLTPKGFKKILTFESIFFGLKSLLYGLPLSLLVIIWIHVTMMNVSSINQVMFPVKSILIAIVAVFVIVYITMIYATHKIKKENILDAIREENI